MTTPSAQPVVIDLGKHKRGKVKKLRRGNGPLLDEAQEAVDQLKASGQLAADAQTVIVVVREKARRNRMMKMF